MSKVESGTAGPYRRVLLARVALATAATATATLLTPPAPAHAADTFKAMLMSVQVDPAAQTLRLVKVGQQTIFFADRPERIAGHVKLADYLTEWTSKAGADNFGKDPPNASLSVFEPDKADNTIAVVTIFDPKIEGDDLIYSYKLIEGTLPAGGGATSPFVDWIGVGGGVGVGFHGVGVGRRGPEFYR